MLEREAALRFAKWQYEWQTRDNTMSAPAAINQFYREKSILITGVTGFVGKVLCEKLLRSCPDIANIYVLLRSRNGKSFTERLNDELLQSPVFANASKLNLKLDKIIAINGDITEPLLGLSSDDCDRIASNVSIVFHSAACVKFHGPLKDFMQQNVFGTDNVMQLCRTITKLEAIVYVSTAYSNCNIEDVEEKVYPLALNARETINKVNCLHSLALKESLMDELLEGRPNAYTFSKALAENLVHEEYSDLPVVIVRPSIVTPAIQEPLMGWIDNFNGVAGAMLLGGLGIARTMKVKCDYIADLIPVDTICNSLVVIGWHTATKPYQRNEVIHITSGHPNGVTWGQFLNHSRDAALNAPSIKVMRPLANNPVDYSSFMGKANYWFTYLISHLLFSYFIDLILAILGYKTLMVKLCVKMHRAFSTLEHFTNRQWKFRNDNYYRIYDSLNSDDKRVFSSDARKLNWKDYARRVHMGTRRYLLKEDDNNIDRARKRFLVVRVLWVLFQLVLLALVWYFIGHPIFKIVNSLTPSISCSNATASALFYTDTIFKSF